MNQKNIIITAGSIIMVLALLFSINSNKNLKSTKSELAGLNKELQESKNDRASTQSQLKGSREQLLEAQTELEDSRKELGAATEDIRGYIESLENSEAKAKAETIRANMLEEKLTIASRALNNVNLNLRFQGNKLSDAMQKIKGLTQEEAKLKQGMLGREIEIQRLENRLTNLKAEAVLEMKKSEKLGKELIASKENLGSKLTELKQEQVKVLMLRDKLEETIRSSENVKITICIRIV